MKNHSTKVTPELQRDLAEYGIFRQEAVKNTTKTNPFMGMAQVGQEYIGLYGTSIETIQNKRMKVAVVAPENETFDMLVTKDFNKAVSTARPDDLRAYIRAIVDKA